MVGDIQRHSAVLQIYIFGVVGVVGYESSLNGITLPGKLMDRVPRSEIRCF